MSSSGVLTLTLSLIFLLSNFCQVEGKCRTYKNYYILGRLEQTPVTQASCDKNDTCSYVSFDIPALAVGSFAGCSGEVHMRLIVHILSRRRDLRDSVEEFLKKNNMALGYPNFAKLSRYGDQLHTFDTMSGQARIFLHFYDQRDDYPTPAVRFEPPTVEAVPVKCPIGGAAKKDCYEGYCATAEVSSVSKDGKSQVSKKVQSCPTELYDELYILAKSVVPNNFTQALLDDLIHMASICASKATQTYLSKAGLSTYYWHIDCYEPASRSGSSHVPAFIFHTPHPYFSFPIYKDDK